MAPPRYVSPGTVLAGRYEVEAEIGRGGFSIVYRALDRSVGTVVALKLLVPPPAAARVARERLRREVQAVRGLVHEGIVAVHDLLDDGDLTFVVMEFVDGPDLGASVDRHGALTHEDTRIIGRDIADALAAAHARGILHRDVKPQNILVGPDGRGRLTDFGSARVADQATMTETGGVVGTLAYMAPEILAGSRGDARSDIYSLGLTLYLALTGDLPERPSRHLPPLPPEDGFHPGALDPTIPDWLDRVVARATSAAPSRRYPSAREIRDALEDAAEAAAAGNVLPQVSCLLCGADDPLELGVCPGCGGGSEEKADAAVFAAHDLSPAARERIGALLAGKVPAEVSRRVLAGQRALVRLPLAAASRVSQRLGESGIPLRVLRMSRAWASMPLAYYAMVIAVALVGTLAGRSFPLLQWLSVPLALAFLLLGQLWLQRPALRLPKRRVTLPSEVEGPVIEALADIPNGNARSLLADVVHAARALAPRLAGMADPDSVERLHDVVRQATRGARELADLEDALARLDRRRRSPFVADGSLDTQADLERTRDRLAQLLLEVVAHLGEARRATADGFLAQEELSSLSHALEDRGRDHAEALAEIEAYLSREAAPA